MAVTIDGLPVYDVLLGGAQDGMINGDENLDFQAAVNRLKTIYTEHLTIIQNQL